MELPQPRRLPDVNFAIPLTNAELCTRYLLESGFLACILKTRVGTCM